MPRWSPTITNYHQTIHTHKLVSAPQPLNMSKLFLPLIVSQTNHQQSEPEGISAHNIHWHRWQVRSPLRHQQSENLEAWGSCNWQGRCWRRFTLIDWFNAFLASPDAPEVIVVSYSLTYWALALTWLMWPWWVMIPIEVDGSYQLMEVINWWKLSTDGSYQPMEVINW